MKRACAMVACLFLTGVMWSQNGRHRHDKHDANGQGCAFCHVQRTSSPAEPLSSAGDRVAVWDCELPSRVFHTYDETGKLDSSPSPGNGQPEMSSMLCASCHDGIATTTMSAAPRLPNHGASLAQGLQTEHPVNVPHDPTKDSSLAALATVTQKVKLFGPGNSVQCSTCHDPHDNAAPKLLRIPNTDSTLCLTCHL